MTPDVRPTKAKLASPATPPSSFVITLWLEPTEGSQRSEWRWRVTEGPGGASRYFRRVSDLLAYVSERADVPPPT